MGDETPKPRFFRQTIRVAWEALVGAGAVALCGYGIYKLSQAPTMFEALLSPTGTAFGAFLCSGLLLVLLALMLWRNRKLSALAVLLDKGETDLADLQKKILDFWNPARSLYFIFDLVEIKVDKIVVGVKYTNIGACNYELVALIGTPCGDMPHRDGGAQTILRDRVLARSCDAVELGLVELKIDTQGAVNFRLNGCSAQVRRAGIPGAAHESLTLPYAAIYRFRLPDATAT